jgi:hypothetical protein
MLYADKGGSGYHLKQGGQYVCGTRTDDTKTRKEFISMEITYTQVGDYLLPNIALSDPPDAPPLGKYGMMHKEYLREHKPMLYSSLLLSERLYPICREVDSTARHRLATISDRAAAHVIILFELVYC